jgi:hypothetical protein
MYVLAISNRCSLGAFPTPVRFSGSDSGRLDNEQLQEAWSIIERLITHGADTDVAIDAAFSHLVDGQDLLKIGLLEPYRSVKQRPKPYNTKLQFVDFERICGSLQQQKARAESISIDLDSASDISDVLGKAMPLKYLTDDGL